MSHSQNIVFKHIPKYSRVYLEQIRSQKQYVNIKSCWASHIYIKSCWASHRSEGFLNGIFDPCTWWSRGLTRCGEFLGRRRRRRRRQSENVQIWGNTHFFQNGHVSNFQKCLFFRNKSPCGSIRQTKVAFQNLPPQNKFNFTVISKSDFYPEFFFW